MKRILSSILVVAMMLTMVSGVFAADTNRLHLGSTEISGNINDVISVPVYLTGANDADLTVPSGVTFRVSMPAGLSATVTAGSMPVDGYVTVSTSKSRINVFYDGAAFTAKANEPLFTINYTASAVGEYDLAFSSVDFANLTLEAVGAKLTVTEASTEPPVSTTNKLHLGAETISGKVGEAIAVPVYLTGAGNTDLTVPSGVTFRVSMPAGLSATVTAGSMPVDGYVTVSTSKSRINVFYDGAAFTAKANEPLFTINYTASAAGEYDLEFSSVDFATLTLEAVGAKLVAEATTPVAPVLDSIEVAPTALEIPYGTDSIVDFIKSKITVTAKYSDDSSSPVTEYAVTVDANVATVTYEGKTATIALTFEPAPVPVLQSIVVDPTELTVPYENQTDTLAYVKSQIKSVTAKYDIADDVVLGVSDYTVTVEGDVATVAYEDKTATIALTLEDAPVVEDTNKLHLGAETINGKAGEVIAVPVYLTGANNTDLTVPSGVTFRVSMPAGLSATVTAGSMPVDGYVTVSTSKSRINVFYDGAAFTAKANEPLFTINYTASAAGEYDLEFSSVDFASLSLEAVGAKLVVEAAAVKQPSITVAPEALEIPYGTADVAAYIKENVNVTYFEDIGAEGVAVAKADFEVTEDGVVTYNSLTANVAITKVTVTSIAVDMEEIVVPYGTADVEAYVLAEAAKATVTVTLSNGSGITTTGVATYANGVVTITVDEATDTIAVSFITAASLKVTPATVVVPYGEDAVEYIKTAVDVKVVLSDGSEVAPLGEIAYEAGEGVVTVTADDVSAEVAYTMGENPEEIVSIAADKESVNVPYANKDAVEAFIAANVAITATKRSGDEVTVGITAENVVAADGVATITVEGVETSVDYVVEEITGIVATPETLDIAWTVEDIKAYVAENVDVYYTYSMETANSEVAEFEVAVEGDEATITVGEYTTTVALNIEPTPDFTKEIVESVYALPGYKVVVITMLTEGVACVDGVDAVKVADDKFVFVTNSADPVITVDDTRTAEIVKWGTLHLDDDVTALDALIALNAANGVIADQLSENVNTYIKADLDLDYAITSADALAINNISLGKTVTVTSAE